MCLLGTLECAPLKVSGSILPGANFGGLVWLIKKKCWYYYHDNSPLKACSSCNHEGGWCVRLTM